MEAETKRCGHRQAVLTATGSLKRPGNGLPTPASSIWLPT